MSDYSWIGPLIQGVGNLAGQGQGVAGADQQNDLLKKAYQRALDMLQSGELSYTPDQVSGVGPSAMEGVAADPASILAQREALQRLGAASKSGFDDIDKAAINRTMNEANANERSQREAALARMDPNSGAALAARLSAQQSGANRANQQGLDIAAMSRKRALDALGKYGGLASDIRGQSFGEGAKRADAMDSIAKFNSETSRFNANLGANARQNSIGNKLGALGAASGAGGLYGQGLANAGKLRGQMTATGGQILGSGINAATSKNGSGGSDQPAADDNYLTPEEEEALNRNDDE